MIINRIKKLKFTSLSAKILAVFLIIGLLLVSHMSLQFVLNNQVNIQLTQLQQILNQPPETTILVIEKIQSELKNKQKTLLITLGIMTLFIIISGFFFLKNTLILPVKQLISNFKRLAQGEENIVLRIDRSDELGLLGACFNEININLQQAMSTWELVMESEACKAAISDAALDGILTLDSHLIINTFNSTADKMIEIDDVDMSGQYFPDIAFTEKDKENYTALLYQVSDEKRESIFSHVTEVNIKGRENKIFPAEISVASVIQKGEPIYIIYIKDISLQKQAKLDMQKSRDAALILARKQGDFMANISHELLTPMNGLLGMLTILNNELTLQDNPQKHMDAAIDSSCRLQDIINKIINFSQLDSDKIEVCNVDFLIKDLIDVVNKKYTEKAKDKQLIFTTNISSDCPISAHSDPKCIIQSLDLLLENAIKFTIEGHIAMDLKFDNSEQNLQLIFTISDTGCGIGKDDQEIIFNPFTQADSSRSRAYDGAGIGLYICKEISELLGGTISVNSALNEGSKFQLSIPFIKTLTENFVKLEYDNKENQPESPNALASIDLQQLSTIFDLFSDEQKETFINGIIGAEKQALEQLLVSIEDENTELACQFIHTLKNTYSNIHAVRILDICNELEKNITSDISNDDILIQLNTLKTESTNIIEILNQYI